MNAPEDGRTADLPDADETPATLLAGYALHALSPGETAAVEEYLATHSDAANDVALLKETAAMLPSTLPPMTPSPQLRLRLMADVYREALAEAGDQSPAPQPIPIERARTRRNSGVIWPFAAVILLILSLGFGSWAVTLNRDLGARDHVIATQSSAIAAAGTTRPLSATSANVPARGEVLRLANNQAAVLTIAGLPALTNGKVYEVWFIAGATPVGAGLFSPNPDGTWSGLLHGDVTNAQAVAISVEPSGGSPAPTGDVVAKGSL